MADLKSQALEAARTYIKTELEADPKDFQVAYDRLDRESGQYVVHVIELSYLKEAVPGGSEMSRELYIDDAGKVVRALKWQ